MGQHLQECDADCIRLEVKSEVIDETRSTYKLHMLETLRLEALRQPPKINTCEDLNSIELTPNILSMYKSSQVIPHLQALLRPVVISFFLNVFNVIQ